MLSSFSVHWRAALQRPWRGGRGIWVSHARADQSGKVPEALKLRVGASATLALHGAPCPCLRNRLANKPAFKDPQSCSFALHSSSRLQSILKHKNSRYHTDLASFTHILREAPLQLHQQHNTTQNTRQDAYLVRSARRCWRRSRSGWLREPDLRRYALNSSLSPTFEHLLTTFPGQIQAPVTTAPAAPVESAPAPPAYSAPAAPEESEAAPVESAPPAPTPYSSIASVSTPAELSSSYPAAPIGTGGSVPPVPLPQPVNTTAVAPVPAPSYPAGNGTVMAPTGSGGMTTSAGSAPTGGSESETEAGAVGGSATQSGDAASQTGNGAGIVGVQTGLIGAVFAGLLAYLA